MAMQVSHDGCVYRSSLAALPSEILENIAARLTPRQLACLAQTCSFFRALAPCAIPGLNLKLFPHQVLLMDNHWQAGTAYTFHKTLCAFTSWQPRVSASSTSLHEGGYD